MKEEDAVQMIPAGLIQAAAAIKAVRAIMMTTGSMGLDTVQAKAMKIAKGVTATVVGTAITKDIRMRRSVDGKTEMKTGRMVPDTVRATTIQIVNGIMETGEGTAITKGIRTRLNGVGKTEAAVHTKTTAEEIAITGHGTRKNRTEETETVESKDGMVIIMATPMRLKQAGKTGTEDIEAPMHPIHRDIITIRMKVVLPSRMKDAITIRMKEKTGSKEAMNHAGIPDLWTTGVTDNFHSILLKFNPV